MFARRHVVVACASWLYAGEVALTSNIRLADVPLVIPCLRLQQSKLRFVSDTSRLPSSHPFARAMERATKTHPRLEVLAAEAEDRLQRLVSENDRPWLGDGSDGFFEFTCFEDGDTALRHVELFASKAYHSRGVVSVALYHRGTWYLALDEGDDFPLLDSKFPDLSKKGRGYNVRYYPGGVRGLPELRKMALWSRSPGDGEETAETLCSKVEAVLTLANADASADNGTEEENSLKAKLETLCNTKAESASDKQPAWDKDGKPLHDQVNTSSKNLAHEQHDTLGEGDVYAQLDHLERNLDSELQGLKELGVLKTSESITDTECVENTANP